MELERYEKGEFVQEKKKKTVRVEEAGSALDIAQDKYDDMPALLDEGFVTPAQVEEDRIKVVKAKSELELAELDLHTYLEYTHPKQLEQKQADVKNAGLEVDRATQRAKAREAQKRSSLDRQKTELANVRITLQQKSEIYENMTIRAPGPGLVIYGDARDPWDDREIRVGEFVYSGQAFLTLPDLSEMQAVVAVHEADISRVKPGQRAVVTVETARGQVVEGKVSKVAAVASSSRRRWSDQAKRFSVEILIEGDIDGLELKPGLTAKVEIEVDALQDVLAVPSQCVFTEAGKFYVFKGGEGRPARVPVEISDGNSSFVVIQSGLKAGDRVLLYNPRTPGAAAPRPRPEARRVPRAARAARRSPQERAGRAARTARPSRTGGRALHEGRHTRTWATSLRVRAPRRPLPSRPLPSRTVLSRSAANPPRVKKVPHPDVTSTPRAASPEGGGYGGGGTAFCRARGVRR